MSFMGDKTESISTSYNWSLLFHSALFVMGFTTAFSFLGASVGLVGYVVQDYQRWINLVAGSLLALFGLHGTGLLRSVTLKLVAMEQDDSHSIVRRRTTTYLFRMTSLLYSENRIDYRPRTRTPLASLMVGMAFAVGWTPCVGFILGAILTAAINQSDATQAMLLLFVYSLGLGTPFILTAAFIDRAPSVLSVLAHHLMFFSVVSGVALMVFGLLIALDLTSQLNQFLGAIPILDDAFLLEGTASRLGLSWLGPSFLAGLLSFLSPCVFPMVPIYLAHLVGMVAVPTTIKP